jgi:hypothetical protein
VWAFDEGASWLRSADYLKNQMFTKNKRKSSKEGFVSILSERPASNSGGSNANKQRLN